MTEIMNTPWAGIMSNFFQVLGNLGGDIEVTNIKCPSQGQEKTKESHKGA